MFSLSQRKNETLSQRRRDLISPRIMPKLPKGACSSKFDSSNDIRHQKQETTTERKSAVTKKNAVGQNVDRDHDHGHDCNDDHPHYDDTSINEDDGGDTNSERKPPVLQKHPSLSSSLPRATTATAADTAATAVATALLPSPRHNSHNYYQKSSSSREEEVDNKSALDHDGSSEMTARSTPVRPTANDVLCGRGRLYFSHPANQHFREVVGHHVAEYEANPHRRDRSRLIHEVVRKFMNQQVRFLKYDKAQDYWYNAGWSAAKNKVSHGLRDALSTKNKSIAHIHQKRQAALQPGEAQRRKGKPQNQKTLEKEQQAQVQDESERSRQQQLRCNNHANQEEDHLFHQQRHYHHNHHHNHPQRHPQRHQGSWQRSEAVRRPYGMPTPAAPFVGAFNPFVPARARVAAPSTGPHLQHPRHMTAETTKKSPSFVSPMLGVPPPTIALPRVETVQGAASQHLHHPQYRREEASQNEYGFQGQTVGPYGFLKLQRRRRELQELLQQELDTVIVLRDRSRYHQELLQQRLMVCESQLDRVMRDNYKNRHRSSGATQMQFRDEGNNDRSPSEAPYSHEGNPPPQPFPFATSPAHLTNLPSPVEIDKVRHHEDRFKIPPVQNSSIESDHFYDDDDACERHHDYTPARPDYAPYAPQMYRRQAGSESPGTSQDCWPECEDVAKINRNASCSKTELDVVDVEDDTDTEELNAEIQDIVNRSNALQRYQHPQRPPVVGRNNPPIWLADSRLADLTMGPVHPRWRPTMRSQVLLGDSGTFRSLGRYSVPDIVDDADTRYHAPRLSVCNDRSASVGNNAGKQAIRKRSISTTVLDSQENMFNGYGGVSSASSPTRIANIHLDNDFPTGQSQIKRRRR